MMMNKVVLAALTAVATSALFAVSTENTYARVKVTPPSSSVKSIIVAVPVTSATDGTDVKVTDLIMPFNLKKDDSILKWNGSAYDGWKWNGTTWEEYTVAKADEGVVTQSETPVADTALARGTAFWFNRAEGFNDESLYLWGQFAADPVTSEVQQGSKAQPVWTLLGNPKAESYSFTNLPSGKEGDEIWILDNSGQAQKCVFHSDQWSTISVVSETNDKGMTVSKVVYTPVRDSRMYVKPGHGFWYMSVGGAPTFKW